LADELESHGSINKKRGYSMNHNLLILLVPRDRIELPTRGFSDQQAKNAIFLYFQHVDSA